MKAMSNRIVGPLAIVAAVIIAGCASRAPAPVVDRPPKTPSTVSADGSRALPETYTVKRGDTLYSIAREQGVDYRELLALNALPDPGRLEVGQVLRLRQPLGAASDTGVQVRPIAGAAPIEARPLETRPLGAEPARPAPAAPTTAEARAEPARPAIVKTEPRGQKLPYSEENLAALQRADERPSAPRTDTASPAKPEPTPKPEPAAAAKPEPSAKADVAPAAKPDAKAAPDANEPDKVDWAWPASGRVLANFSDANKGIDVAGKVGEPVYASAAGRVVYSGAGLRGYGNLIIVKHNDSYLSAYAHNSKLFVKEGQSVSKGQKIAEVGSSDTDQPKLHFEIRRLGKPVDPTRYLPSR